MERLTDVDESSTAVSYKCYNYDKLRHSAKFYPEEKRDTDTANVVKYFNQVHGSVIRAFEEYVGIERFISQTRGGGSYSSHMTRMLLSKLRYPSISKRREP